MPGTTPRGYPYPLYTEANNFPTQLGAFATAVDTDVQNTLVTAVNTGLNQPACRLSSTVSQSIAANTDVVLTYVTEEFDNNNFFTVGTSNTNINIVSAGLYMISASLIFSADATVEATRSFRSIIGKRNGGIRVAKTLTSVTYDVCQMNMTWLQECLAGDIITIFARHNAAAARTVTDKRVSLNRITVA